MTKDSTTPDLVELTRRSYRHGSARDWDGVMTIYGPDSVWDMSAVGLGVFEGCDDIRGFFEDWTGPYEGFEQELEEVRDLGNGVVFQVARHDARPVGSAAFVEFRYALVAVWVDGLIERATAYADIDEARAAAERLAEERGRRCRGRTWRLCGAGSSSGARHPSRHGRV
jgi:hypothetical protein